MPGGSIPRDDDEVFARLVAYISERSGVGADVIQRVLELEQGFWADRPTLTAQVLGLDDEDDA